jgi:4-hydroxy-3-polyprenylbenzoate decarboxylase
MINWAICFNVRPEEDVFIAQGKSPGLDPSAYPPGVPTHESRLSSTSALLINATRPWPYPPVSLPSKEFMERAKAIWEELEFPELRPRMPWFGYSLGAWTPLDEEEAELALRGEHFRTGEKAKQERVKA